MKITGERPGDTAVTYDKGGWVFWMLLNHMGRDQALPACGRSSRLIRATRTIPCFRISWPSMRPFAADPAAFDAFTQPVVLRGRGARYSCY